MDAGDTFVRFKPAKLDHEELPKRVFAHSKEIRDWLNVDELFPHFITPKYQFLSGDELLQLMAPGTLRSKAGKLLLILRKKSWSDTRKFVACLLVEEEHRGHTDIVQVLIKDLPLEELAQIMLIVNDGLFFPCAGQGSPQKSLPPIELQGPLLEREYIQLEERLWGYFAARDYASYAELCERMQSSEGSPFDWKISGLWFESLLSMLRDGEYTKCADMLLVALKKVQESDSANKIYLEGRLHRRLTYVYEIMGKKEEAAMHFAMARQLLMFVGQGYDKHQMFTKEARMLAATAPEEYYKCIDNLFSSALDMVPKDSVIASLCITEICLSKAAFHLQIPFGSKPDPENLMLPSVSPTEITKVEDILKLLPQDQKLTIRKYERKLICAELLRHKPGKSSNALAEFEKIICDPKAANLKYLIAIADHRCQSIRQRSALMTELLQGLSQDYKHSRN